jgi:hypothetical protein
MVHRSGGGRQYKTEDFSEKLDNFGQCGARYARNCTSIGKDVRVNFKIFTMDFEQYIVGGMQDDVHISSTYCVSIS